MEGATKIMHAAVDLFLQYGFKNVTMDDVARRAGISKKTLYQHFSNKPELVTASVTWYMEMNAQMCRKAITEASNALETLVRVDAELESIYRKLNPLSMLELQRFYPEAWERFREVLVKQDVEMIRETIARGIQEELIRPELDPELIARYRIETAMMSLQPNLMVSDRYSLMHVGYTITELFIYGIATAKGVKLYTRYKENYYQKPNKA